MKSSSFINDHPWMTFFLAGAIVNGIVTVVRGYPRDDQQPRVTPHTRGTYK
jgi:hypothetical protein